MNRNCLIFDYILIGLGTISLIYFIIVTMSSRFISAYFIYPIFTIILWFYSYYELRYHISILSSLPKGLNYGLKTLITIIAVLFIVLEGLIIHQSKNQYHQPSDFVIVLGARLNGSTPSALLRYRLEATVDYHEQYPDSYIIVSGGQGDGEDISEAKAMKDYLVNHGIDENLIIKEDQSTNTNENILYSKKIIDSMTSDDYDVVIITNGFHCYRSLILAHKHNLSAHTYGARERLDTAPHYYIREFFGCLKDILIS